MGMVFLSCEEGESIDLQFSNEFTLDDRVTFLCVIKKILDCKNE